MVKLTHRLRLAGAGGREWPSLIAVPWFLHAALPQSGEGTAVWDDLTSDGKHPNTTPVL